MSIWHRFYYRLLIYIEEQWTHVCNRKVSMQNHEKRWVNDSVGHTPNIGQDTCRASAPTLVTIPAYPWQRSGYTVHAYPLGSDSGQDTCMVAAYRWHWWSGYLHDTCTSLTLVRIRKQEGIKSKTRLQAFGLRFQPSLVSSCMHGLWHSWFPYSFSLFLN